MYYRIEFNKDGSIANCRAVESRFKSGNLVVYVEADDAPAACEKAQSHFTKWRAEKEAKAEQFGLCLKCFKRPRANSTIRCAPCLRASARQAKQRRELERLPPEQQEAAYAAHRQAIRERRTAGAAILIARMGGSAESVGAVEAA